MIVLDWIGTAMNVLSLAVALLFLGALLFNRKEDPQYVGPKLGYRS